MKKILLALVAITAAFVSCTRDPDVPVTPATPQPPTVPSPVVFDMEMVPYANLSEYNFFAGDLANLDPVPGVLPYDVNTPLFSDYAQKKRFVWMPQGVSAQYAGDHQVLGFPEGTVLIKNFYYDHVLPDDSRQLIETRLMFKRAGEWEFANYVWNNEQTEATFDLSGSYRPLTITQPDGSQLSVNYRIPAAGECLTCHKVDMQPMPIGPKPQNINKLHAYDDGVMDQMAKWVQVGYLQSGFPASMETTVEWDDITQPLHDRVRAYLDMNCSHCHADQKHCDYRPIRFAWSETTDPENLGICVAPDETFDPTLIHIVSVGNIDRSMLHFRMSATEENLRMPLLGRTVVHQEALQLVEEWINTLSPPCN